MTAGLAEVDVEILHFETAILGREYGDLIAGLAMLVHGGMGEPHCL